MKERQRETETDRQTETKRDRYRDRDRETETKTETDRQTDRQSIIMQKQKLTLFISTSLILHSVTPGNGSDALAVTLVRVLTGYWS